MDGPLAMTATRLSFLLAVFPAQAVANKALAPLLNFATPDTAEKWQAVNDGVLGGERWNKLIKAFPLLKHSLLQLWSSKPSLARPDGRPWAAPRWPFGMRIDRLFFKPTPTYLHVEQIRADARLQRQRL